MSGIMDWMQFFIDARNRYVARCCRDVCCDSERESESVEREVEGGRERSDHRFGCGRLG